jgi:hypothetical protein
LGIVSFGVVDAQEISISFGIRPTEAVEGRPETFSYFSYELLPGESISDVALVLSESDVPLDLALYAADGITNQNGGTGFMLQGESSPGGSQGVADWVIPSVDSVHLEPGDEVEVPFDVEVPSDVAAGHHIAGLIVELSPGTGDVDPGGTGSNFTVNVVQRVGVAVVVEVPGTQVFDLLIQDVGLRSQDPQGATFFVNVYNNGNMMIKGTGLLELTDMAGETIASIPFEMDTVLPGDPATFNALYPGVLPDGDYLLSVYMNYADTSAQLEGILIRVRDGQPWQMDDGDGTPPLDGGSDQNIIGSFGEHRDLIFAIAMFVVAGGGAVLLFFVIRRMARN